MMKRASKLSLELFPAIGLGVFSLGMSVRSAVQKMQELENAVGRFDLKYCKEDPLATHVLLDLVEDGFLLRFDPASQRLLSIEIYNASLLNISYNTNIFCSQDVKPTFDQVYKTFGPTHPGKFDENQEMYELVYPGLQFLFNASHVKKKTDLPLKNADGTSPIATRITIVESSTRKSSAVDDVDELTAKIGYGIELAGGDVLTFDSTTQDCLSILGQPSRIFTKHDDKLKIHSATAMQSPATDYFFNYFDLGIDVLFDSQRHTAKKFVLHTNSPHSVNFNRYSKCFFRLLVRDTIIAPDDTFDTIRTALKLDTDPLVQMTNFGVVLFYGMSGVVFEVAQANDCLLSITLFET